MDAAFVITAHNRDDRAETVLMRFLSGASGSALSGIARERGIYLRPLLGISHPEMTAWLGERGFSWREEVLARVDKLVPYNVEERMKERGANYSKALVPFVSNAVVDGRLVTGQNPGSAKETATKVAALL